MIIRFPHFATANDNVSAWTRGYADGRAEEWSERLANEGDHIARQYLMGWLAGSESHPASVFP